MLRVVAVFFIFLLSFANHIKAQTEPSAKGGSISGVVKDGKSGETVMGALVNIPSDKKVTITDMEGKYLIEGLPAGKYKIIISFMGYRKDSAIVTLSAEAPLTHNVNLAPDVLETKTVTVAGQRKTNTDVSLLNEIKVSHIASVGVSAQLIAKSQDRDASEVVKRLPGVNIMNDRFIMVRGLNERYNSVFLNNLQAPSVEADSRAFAFDLIPSGMIEQLLIFKSPAPELPGDFAGGAIKIITKNYSREGQLSVNLSGSYRPGSTFETGWQDKAGKTDWLGMDDGSRNLPTDFPDWKTYSASSTSAANTEFAKKLSNTWFPTASTMLPDTRTAISYTKGWKIGNLFTLGSLTSLNHSLTNAHNTVYRRDFNDKDTMFHYTDEQYTRNARIGVIQNLSFVFSPKHKVELKGMFNQLGKQQTTIRQGADAGMGPNRQYAYYYQNRTIGLGQISGKHVLFNEKGTLDWAAGLSRADKNEPDFRRVFMFYQAPNPDAPKDSSKAFYFMNIQKTVDPRNAGRIFQHLKEKSYTATVQYEHKFHLNSKNDGSIVGGWFMETKSRDFEARWFSYIKKGRTLNGNYTNNLLPSQLDTIFNPSHMNGTNGFGLGESTNGSDVYHASNQLNAGYMGVHLEMFAKKLEVYPGARYEYNVQQLNSEESGKKLSINRPFKILLPSLNMTWHLAPEHQLRLGAGRTVNRPEFRELAPYVFYDFEFNRAITGDSSLKTCTIDNYDLRYEWYPSPQEVVTLGVFYKNFINPIESIAAAVGNNSYTFRNGKSAYDYGAEIEIRKQLNFFPKASKAQKLMEHFSMLINLTGIVSRVSLPDSVEKSGLNSKRPLQGQSPYIVNVGLFYQSLNLKTSISASWNVTGQRIMFVGYPGYGDIYEMPRHALDVTLTQKLNKHISLKGGAQNILNSAVRYMQNGDANVKLENNGIDHTLMYYKPGSYYTLGVNIVF